MRKTDAGRLKLPPGWYVQLAGDKFDLEDWAYSLNEPFDPVVMEEPDGTFLLKSSEFDSATTAEEVREKAKALINRLNGAMTVMHGARPVQVGGIIQVDDSGGRHASVFGEAVAIALGRARARATSTVCGPNGEELPPLPPQPSDAQRWNTLAAADDRVADLLEQLGKAADWYEIYKTIEFARDLAGGEQKLWTLLGTSAVECRNLKQTANFFRHALAPRPKNPTPMADAKGLLNYMVRNVIEASTNDSRERKPECSLPPSTRPDEQEAR